MLFLLSQTTQPVTIPGLDATSLATIIGIIGIVWNGLGLIKPYLAQIKFLAAIPVFVWALIGSLALTAAAVYVTHTLTAPPALLAIAVIVEVLASAGFHIDGSIITFFSQSLGNSHANDVAGVQAGTAPETH